MAYFPPNDRVRETTADTGAGDYTLSATSDFRRFSSMKSADGGASIADGDLVDYAIVLGSAFEVGICPWRTGNVLQRTAGIVKSSSNGGALVSFGAGTKDVFNDAGAHVINAAVRSDVSQSLSAAQKDQASVNIGAVRAIRIQKFTANGTYTPDPNLLYAIAEGVGGGGGGAGVPGPAANQITVGGGGQAGSYARRLLTAAQIGASKAVTIGNGANGGSGAANGSTGGTTTLGSLLSAGGGGGGSTMGGSAPAYAIQGGSGGTATVGDVLIIGEVGSPGIGVYPMITGGQGGTSFFGSGGAAAIAVGAASNGNGSPSYGGGGSGSGSATAGGGGTGGNGGPGMIVVTEFCSK